MITNYFLYNFNVVVSSNVTICKLRKYFIFPWTLPRIIHILEKSHDMVQNIEITIVKQLNLHVYLWNSWRVYTEGRESGYFIF